jgi:hypothetical protein
VRKWEENWWTFCHYFLKVPHIWHSPSNLFFHISWSIEEIVSILASNVNGRAWFLVIIHFGALSVFKVPHDNAVIFSVMTVYVCRWLPFMKLCRIIIQKITILVFTTIKTSDLLFVTWLPPCGLNIWTTLQGDSSRELVNTK